LNKKESWMLIKKLPIENRQYILYSQILRLARKNNRSFAGYLFGELGKSIFYKNESVFKADFQLGILGPNSFGRETQRFLHKLVGYKSVRG
jgi:hypothetical protein